MQNNKSLYDTDFLLWSEQQKALLEAGRFDELDLNNLIEEVDSMGKSDINALQSRLIQLYMYLLKWRYQPERQGTSWTLSVNNQRIEIEDLIEQTPSLKSRISDVYPRIYKTAVKKAALETGMPASAFPDSPAWEFSQIMDEDFWPSAKS